MDENLPDKEVLEENASQESQEMESDDVLSEPVAVTNNTDSANEASAPDEKPTTSQIPSDDTSGIEIVSTSTTSASEIPHEDATASEIAQPSPVQIEPAETEMATSASEIPCEGGAESDAEDNTEPSSIHTEPADEQRSITSDAAFQSEETVASNVGEKFEKMPEESEIVSQSMASGSPVPCIEESEDKVKRNDGEAALTETSPRQKKGIIEKVKKFLSPTKSKKSKSRSKSMSPSERTKCCATENSNATPETHVSEGEEHAKNESEKSGKFNIKSLKRRLSKLSMKIKSPGAESTSLVTNEVTERTEDTKDSKSKTEVETKENLEQSTLVMPKWTNNRTSLTEVPSLGGTTMTDVPSTSSSSVFSTVSSRKPSAAGENASEEAVTSSLVNSPDGQIEDIKEEINTDNENVNDLQSEEENKEVVASENVDEQLSLDENPKSAENNEENPGSEN